MNDATIAARAKALLDREMRRLLTLALLHESHAEHLRERAHGGAWLKKYDDCALCVCERPWSSSERRGRAAARRAGRVPSGERRRVAAEDAGSP